MLVSCHYNRFQFDLLNVICGEVLEQESEANRIVSAALKEYTSGNADGVVHKDVLSRLGYHVSDFSVLTYKQNIIFVAAGFLTGVFIFIFSFLYRNKVEAMRIRNLADYLEQIQKQLLWLTHLEEALLILSRLDAGTLVLQKKEIDVFTVLVLAADNLQELFLDSGTLIDIPESGEMAITADLDWTMEAVINLIKNCMEHHIGGTIHCSYEQNPLYTEILIWDEGDGFDTKRI